MLHLLPEEMQWVEFLSTEFHNQGKWFHGLLLFDDYGNPEEWWDENEIYHSLENVSEWRVAMIPEQVTERVRWCSACGQSHEITFNRLAEPATVGEFTYGYSGNCEEKDREVFMRYNEKKEVEVG